MKVPSWRAWCVLFMAWLIVILLDRMFHFDFVLLLILAGTAGVSTAFLEHSWGG